MDKRTIIAFVLIGMIIVLYGEYARWISPPPPPEPIETIAATDTAKPQPAAEHAAPALLAPAASETAAPYPAATVAGLISPAAAPERFVTVETERFIARLSSHGAQLVSLKLKPNGRYLKQEIELLHQDRRGAHPSYRFWMVNGPVETADLAFEVAGWDESRDLELNVKGSETRQLIFTAPLDSVRRLSIIYSFSGNRYTLTSEVKGHLHLLMKIIYNKDRFKY